MTADLNRIAAEVMGKHGYIRTTGGHECPCGHVYVEQPPGAYMVPDLDWLDRVIVEHRAAEVVAALLDALGAETRQESATVVHTEGAQPYRYPPCHQIDAEIEAARLRRHLAPGMFNGRRFVRAAVERRTVTSFPRLVGDWEQVDQ